MKKLVKYKLEKVPNGFKHPDYIEDGGYVWQNGRPCDMIFVGKTEIRKGELPPCVLEVITKAKLDKHKKETQAKLITKYRAERYAKEADPLFIEAFREKELGNDKKWKQYLKICEEIKNSKK